MVDQTYGLAMAARFTLLWMWLWMGMGRVYLGGMVIPPL
jgi:hypothetical protein